MRIVIKALPAIAIFLLLMQVCILETGGDAYVCSNGSVTPAVSQVGEWRMFRGGPDHTGFADGIAPGTNAVMWSFTTGKYTDSSPAVTDGRVYIGSSTGSIYCLDATTGALFWNHSVGQTGSSPAVYGGRVYIGSNSNYLYCLDQYTGKELWKFQGPVSGLTSPAVSAGRVVISSFDGRIFCLNSTTGKSEWNYSTNNETTNCFITSSPAVSGDRVYVGSTSGFIYALDLDGTLDGKNDGIQDPNTNNSDLVWKTGFGNRIMSSPAVSGGNVYVYVDGDVVSSLNATTGAINWSKSITGKLAIPNEPLCARCFRAPSPAVAYGNVYAISNTGLACCLDKANGSVKWYSDFGSLTVSSPAVADGKVYFGTMGNMFLCLNATSGDSIWSYEANDIVTSSPAICYSKVYVGTADGRVLCFAPASYSLSATMAISPGILNATEHGKISVTVTNNTVPVQGAMVRLSCPTDIQLDNFTGKTGIDGIFTTGFTPHYIRKITNISISARAVMDRYNDASIARSVEVHPVLLLTHAAKPSVTVSGGTVNLTIHVRDGYYPVSGALIGLSSNIGGSFHPAGGTTDLGANFYSEFTSPVVQNRTECIVNVTAVKAGFRQDTASIAITVNPSNVSTLLVNVSAIPGNVVSGGATSVSIMVSNGTSGVGGVLLDITADSGSCLPSSGLTNSSRAFLATFRAPQTAEPVVCTVQVAASKAGFSDGEGSAQVIVAPEPALDVNAIAIPATIWSNQTCSVSVGVESGGIPAANASVTATATEGNLSATSGKTGSSGWFNLSFTAPYVMSKQTCIVNITCQKVGYRAGYAAVQVNVQPSTIPILSFGNISIRPSQVVSGESAILTAHIVAGGTGVYNVNVSVSANARVSSSPGGYTDINGYFSYLLTASNITKETNITVTLRAEKKGYFPAVGIASYRVLPKAVTPAAKEELALGPIFATSAILFIGTGLFVAALISYRNSKGRKGRLSLPAALMIVVVVVIVLLPLMYYDVSTGSGPAMGNAYAPDFQYKNQNGNQNSTQASNGSILILHFMYVQHNWNAWVYDEQNNLQLDAFVNIYSEYQNQSQKQVGKSGVRIITIVVPSCCLPSASDIFRGNYNVSKVKWPVQIDTTYDAFLKYRNFITDPYGKLREDPLLVFIGKDHRIDSVTGGMNSSAMSAEIDRIAAGEVGGGPQVSSGGTVNLVELYGMMVVLGIASFVAPCCLALQMAAVPYLSGIRITKGETRLKKGRAVRKTVRQSKHMPGVETGLSFAMGIGTVFLVIGLFVSYFNSIVQLRHNTLLFNCVAGVMLIVVGIYTVQHEKGHDAGNDKSQRHEHCERHEGHVENCKDCSDVVKKGSVVERIAWFSRTHSFFGPFALGIIFGILGIPCAIAFVIPAIILVVSSNAPLVIGCVLLFIFGISRGILVMPFVLVVRATRLRISEKSTKWGRLVTINFAILIVCIGIYLIVTNLP